MSHLAVVLAPFAVAGDRYQLSDKTVSGMRALADRWNGRITFVTAASTGQDANLGLGWHSARELGMDVIAGEPASVVRDLRPAVVQASLVLRDREVVDTGRPTVLVAENPVRERLRYAWPTLPTADRPRAVIGAVRQGVRQTRMLKTADALACNGWSAWHAYAAQAEKVHETPPLLFFDTRLSLSRVAEARARLQHRSHDGPLRFAFSGRLHPAKGPQHAVEASVELDRRGVRHSMLILGDGPMRADLERVHAPSVTFAGSLDFEPDWVRRVSEEVDVMVLPHTQGDPSGTYLEAAGLGVPVAGFGNAALRGHEHHGFAWACAAMRASSLADLLEELDRNRERVREGAERGVDFMSQHAFETSFDARVDQLVEVAAAGERRRDRSS